MTAIAPLNIAFSLVMFLLIPGTDLRDIYDQAEADQSVAEYTLGFVGEKPMRVSVTARMPVSRGRIFMNPFGADHLSDGWTSFVRNLRVLDSKNRPLRFTTEQNASWRISGGYSEGVVLQYDVDLSFAYERWPAGNEQAGFYEDGALFLVARPLFITSEADVKRIVRFEVPAGWKISTPWEPSAADPGAFVAENQAVLLNNTMVVGRHAEHTFQEGLFTFILALPGRIGNSSDLIIETLKKPVRAYCRIFDQTPKSRFMVTLFYADQEDGEGYTRSAAFTTRDSIKQSNLILWGNTLAHELFHFWNGQQMRGEPRASREWFSEGFTEYYANRTLIREGLISEDLFIKKMEKHIGMYLYFKSAPAFTGISILQSGERKSYYRPRGLSGRMDCGSLSRHFDTRADKGKKELG